MLEEFDIHAFKGTCIHIYAVMPTGKRFKVGKTTHLGFNFDFRLSLIAWNLFFNILNSNNSKKYLAKFEIASRPVCWRQEKLFEEKT
jgi:hypothetical protein